MQGETITQGQIKEAQKNHRTLSMVKKIEKH